MLQVAEKSIYRLVHSDPTMPVLRFGGSLRFHRQRLENWLRSKEQGGDAATPVSETDVLSGSASSVRGPRA
jgi:hypothetical protein